jgi:nicotinic acid mononucleotide adenylyltransferase
MDCEQLVEAIHGSRWRAVIAVTGGGSQAIGELLNVGGASRTLLEGLVPYSAPALCDLLGAEPERYCSEATARAMAMASFERAIRWSQPNQPDHPHPGRSDAVGVGERLVGVSCTASLASDRPKRGDHRAHVGVQTVDYTAVTTLVMEKGARTRREEERLVARLVLNHLASACGIDDELPLELLGDEELTRARADAQPAWRSLMVRAIDAVRFAAGTEAPVETGGSRSAQHPVPTVLFPGAFHPLHEGHHRMAAIAGELLGTAAEFEMSIDNVDKPTLDYIEIESRLAQFAPDQVVWLTRAATFLAKARLFRGAVFVVGADTLARIADVRYYDSEQARDAAIDEIARLGCRFLVFGRVGDRGRFVVPHELKLPPALERLCQSVPEDRFREDISSTDIRRRADDASCDEDD